MIRLGPAGITSEPENFLKKLNTLGLKAAEVAFTYSVYMDNSKAKKIGEIAKKHNISLSIHAPYYVNLNSKDKKKRAASKQRIIKSLERGHHMKATHIVFHPGYYGKDTPEDTFNKIAEAIKEMKKKKFSPKLAPETMGKINVFGSIKEIKKLMRETGCSCCVDFAHLKARSQGKLSYKEIVSKFPGHIHAHFSGIEYSTKGERHHKTTPLNELKLLIKAIKHCSVTLINESPTPVKDSVKTLKILENL